MNKPISKLIAMEVLWLFALGIGMPVELIALCGKLPKSSDYILKSIVCS